MNIDPCPICGGEFNNCRHEPFTETPTPIIIRGKSKREKLHGPALEYAVIEAINSWLVAAVDTLDSRADGVSPQYRGTQRIITVDGGAVVIGFVHCGNPPRTVGGEKQEDGLIASWTAAINYDRIQGQFEGIPLYVYEVN